jgi:hypothetical protein
VNIFIETTKWYFPDKPGIEPIRASSQKNHTNLLIFAKRNYTRKNQKVIELRRVFVENHPSGSEVLDTGDFYQKQLDHKRSHSIYRDKTCSCLQEFPYKHTRQLICFHNDSTKKLVDKPLLKFLKDIDKNQTFASDTIKFELIFVTETRVTTSNNRLSQKSQVLFFDSDLYFDYATNLGYSKSLENFLNQSAALLIDFNVSWHF